MTPHSKSGMNMIYTQIRCLYISLHDSWLLSRTELVLRATSSTPDSSLGRMCLYPLQYRVESHAGWPSLGSGAKGYANYGVSIV